jgi:hypothetical protein
MTKRILNATLLALVSVAVSVSGCGDDDKLNTVDSGCPQGYIGPDGGVEAVTDPDRSLYGVQVEVAPDTWRDCWSVYLAYNSTWSTPNFPDGLEGYEGWLTGSLEFQFYKDVPYGEPFTVPDEMPMAITFPLRDLAPTEGEMLVAFRYDDEAEMWRIALPDAMTDSTITIHTSEHRQLWTWGRVLLHEVDFDLYLAPVLEELDGTDRWLDIQAQLHDLYDSMAEGGLDANCATYLRIRDFLAYLRDASAVDLVGYEQDLGGICGPCDVTSYEFFDEYFEYARLHVNQWFIDLLFVENGPNILIKVWGLIRLLQMEYAIQDLTCNYDCLYDNVASGFYGRLAEYWISVLIVELIDWAIDVGYLDC